MQFHRQRKVSTLLNIAPLIDCVFLLLIFFLLTSSFIEEAGLEIELPQSGYASSVDENKIIISLSEDGLLEVNGKPSNFNRLRDDLAGLIDRLGNHQATIRADKDVKLELLIKTMDIIKASGINSINIQSIPINPPPCIER